MTNFAEKGLSWIRSGQVWKLVLRWCMKIAVLSDIHGNWPALERVAADIEGWRPDVVVVAGDVVNRGPRPMDCLRFVQEKQREQGWLVVRGNHEDYVLYHTTGEAATSGPKFEIWQNSYWNYRQMNGEVGSLEAMPFQVSLTGPDGREVRVVHGSMRGNMDGIYPEAEDEVVRQQISPGPAVLCVGHTHRPLVRRVDGTLVVNAGSVGMPFDGDRRPSYARLVWREGGWTAEIVRLEYDFEAARREFGSEVYTAGGGELTRIIQVELEVARPHLNHWIRLYQEQVLAGELSLKESVSLYLEELEIRD